MSRVACCLILFEYDTEGPMAIQEFQQEIIANSKPPVTSFFKYVGEKRKYVYSDKNILFACQICLQICLMKTFRKHFQLNGFLVPFKFNVEKGQSSSESEEAGSFIRSSDVKGQRDTVIYNN
jgi:hypothetical protein